MTSADRHLTIELMPFHKGISNIKSPITTNFQSRIGHLRFKIRNLKFEEGFTIFEVLVTISVLAILSVIVLQVNSNHQKLIRDATRIADVNKIKVAAEAFFEKNNKYPPTDPACGTQTLFRSDVIPPCATDWIPQLANYEKSLPTDPKPNTAPPPIAFVDQYAAGSYLGDKSKIRLLTPNNVANGDVLVMAVFSRDNLVMNSGSEIPAGWTKLVQRNNGTDLTTAIFYKIANNEPVYPAGYTLNLTLVSHVAGIVAYRNANISSPITYSENSNS